jgi:pyridoxamine 5'-phosphate oxidase
MAIDYTRDEPGFAPLREEDMAADPIAQFQAWYAEAVAAGLPLAEAITLATASPEGKPSARMVLLRAYDERGFVFYTNYDSRKARELAANPQAALVLYWQPLDRQVRIEGRVERVSPEQSDAYWRGRPRDSQLGAWASPQSQVLPGRQILQDLLEEVEARYVGTEIPRPPGWGGFRVVPDTLEFWQARGGRLHDRLRYRQTVTGWLLERLAP